MFAQSLLMLIMKKISH